jgi:S-DNA-T family DNA segregation ATPase FtsK/SpoIIIE
LRGQDAVRISVSSYKTCTEQICYNGTIALINYPDVDGKMAKSRSSKKKSQPKALAVISRLFRGPGKKTSSRSSGKKKSSQVPSGISLDRKLDLVGVGLIVLGALILLGLLTAQQGQLAGMFMGFLSVAIGWGIYVFPLVLIFVGIWLVARDFESVPRLATERLIGLGFLFLLLLVTMHLTVSPQGSEAANLVAESGRGGGKIGGWMMVFFEDGLGTVGLIVVMIGWLLVSLALTLDRSIIELFNWVPPLVLRLQDWWDDRQALRKESTQQPALIPTPEAYVPPHSVVETQPSGGQSIETHPQPTSSEEQLSPLAQAVIERHDWVLPKIEDVLDAGVEVAFNDDYDRQRANLIEETLASFGAPATVVEINRGPTITQFGVEPDFIESRSGRTRVRVNKIAALADDLSLALAAQRIRIQAPVPGKGYIGIEVPNEKISVVALRDVIETEAFKNIPSPLRFALGQDVAGNAVSADLAAMPHLLVAGATGSGKSVCVNAIIACLMLNNTPDTLRFIMVDPKRVELTGYNGIPHLLAPVVTEIERVVGVLQWVTREMDSRYQKFADLGARNIIDYNKRAEAQELKQLPYLVLVIDELADMMMVAPDQTERLITRMAQLARATGIHLVISTQRPSVDVVTGLIKANFPARISFAVASGTDSRVIIDQPGAERLLGRGDMLFQAPDAPAPARLQGVFVSDQELLRAVQYWRGLAGTAPTTTTALGTPADVAPAGIPLKQMPIWDEMQEQEPKDDIYDDAVALVRRNKRASISMLQRKLRIGYTRAARLIEQMEEKGIVGPPTEGSKPRVVLDYGEELGGLGES